MVARMDSSKAGKMVNAKAVLMDIAMVEMSVELMDNLKGTSKGFLWAESAAAVMVAMTAKTMVEQTGLQSV